MNTANNNYKTISKTLTEAQDKISENYFSETE